MSHREIVIGLDDSRSARSALRWGADYARRTGLALRAVHVLSWPLGVTAPGYDGKEAMRHPSFEEVDAIYRASITAVFDELDHPRPDWLIQFARGDAGLSWCDSLRTRRCWSSGHQNMSDWVASSQARSDTTA